MNSPGLLINAGAGRVKRDPSFVERLRARLPDGHLQLTRRVEDIEPALCTLRDLGVKTLVVAGGDGTVGSTLTWLLRVWPEAELPALVLAAGGTVNTIPQSLGTNEHPEAIVERLLEGGTPRSQSTRPAVRVVPETGEARCGMIFGNGVTTRWLEAYYANSHQGVRGAMATVGRAVGSALTGGDLAHDLFAPFRARCEVDGKLLDEQEFTVMGASGVRDVGLGFRPFYHAGEDPGRIHFLVTSRGPVRLSLELPGLWFGAKGSALKHYSAERISVRFETPQPWSMDADLFDPVASLEIGPTPPLRFVSP